MSYATKVATIDAVGWLTCSGTYGQTTRRHIGQFLKEYGEGGANYYNAKYCYQNDMAYNVRTGEILELAEYFKLAKNQKAA